MRPVVFPSVSLLVLLLVILPSCPVLCQHQGQWGQFGPQFVPLPLRFQNFQGGSFPERAQGTPMSGQSDKLPKTTGSLTNGPVLGGKIHLLSTLWRGLRNTGLERSIAGDVLEHLLKISLRDIIVPFKRDVILPLMS